MEIINKAKAAIHRIKKNLSPINEVKAKGSTLVSYSGEVLVGGILKDADFYGKMGALEEMHPGATYSDGSILSYAIPL